MANRFHVGKGRYTTLNTSRYLILTYGRESILEPEEEAYQEEAHGTYGALLFDKRWKEKRNEILTRDNNKCVICNRDEKLQVHHRQYQYIKALKKFKAPWDYENHLLITLCESCHSRGHNKFKIPNVYI
jgi:hypothetical protein